MTDQMLSGPPPALAERARVAKSVERCALCGGLCKGLRIADLPGGRTAHIWCIGRMAAGG